jgi:tRNA G18 (ribose-2'-O)-methylase SpoU
MVLNIGKYQLPYLEYNLLRDYIAANLCVQRNEASNNCQGKCHLEKQIRAVTETEENADNPAIPKQENVQTDDYVVIDNIPQETNGSAAWRFAAFGDVRIAKTGRDVPVPPPKQ